MLFSSKTAKNKNKIKNKLVKLDNLHGFSVGIGDMSIVAQQLLKHNLFIR